MKRLVLLLVLGAGCASLPMGMQVTPRVLNNIRFLYNQMPVEFAFCAFGKVKNDVIHIERIELAYTLAANETSISYLMCDEPGFLGIGHSHPKGTVCEFSETDISTLIRTDSPYAFIACEDKLIWLSRQSVRNREKGL